VSFQVEELVQNKADACGLDRILFWNPKQDRAWEYFYPRSGKPWVYGASFCYRKEFWRRNPFPDIAVGEDTRFIWANQPKKIHVHETNDFLVALVHPGNSSRKYVQNNRYRTQGTGRIRTLLGTDYDHYSLSPDRPPPVSDDRSRCALVATSFGIGDILRTTPMIRVLHRMGFEVSVLAAPDYAETLSLIEGAPEVQCVIPYEGIRTNRGSKPVPGLSDKVFDVAVFTYWSIPLRRWVRAKEYFCFQKNYWLKNGDLACVEDISRALGWKGPLPEPFALSSDRQFDLPSSDRQFDLPPNTIALHPGCKPDWPWKKWHGFEELARRLPSVAIIGSEQDLDNHGTYFQDRFNWPDHALDFVGQLKLADTAALIKQCAALISNDSGLMHLSAAMGVPTFGIFGITNPERETSNAPNLHVITKGLPCEPDCRRAPWGRRDCDRHLECLKTLTAKEVINRMETVLSNPDLTSAPPDIKKTEETLSVTYHGNVFDASGYGHAARAYIHALHRAGVKLSVVDLAPHARQVHDPLVESLMGTNRNADFNLFHGIPSYWAKQAFRLRNSIGITAWETDVMPSQWRNVLNHVLEVWLPSNFNVTTFGRELRSPVIRVPHPVFPEGSQSLKADANQFLGVDAGDFLFFSIFEWQDRKNPQELIESFLKAFPEDQGAVLLIKLNPGAVGLARQTLDQLRSCTSSKGRVILRCEGWDESGIEALHSRGDCYVSLHSGEGWNYPLFEAVCRGTPVIATAYSGPLDYLHPDHHQLVRFSIQPVRQRYAFYNPRMQWAKPDFQHAIELFRLVFSDRKQVKKQSGRATAKVCSEYSLDAVGQVAVNRLFSILKKSNLAKWKRINKQNALTIHRPKSPIAGEWYDADYFEHGLKSNWSNGYGWDLFSGLFRETSKYLQNIFPEAETFLDIGCAKGFMIRALREQEKECWGFDHSPWALQCAEPQARSYILHENTDTVEYHRHFDILVAMSIFESLTEDQIEQFLSRARPWCRHAIFSTITTLPSSQITPRDRDDDDLSHITLRSREWWHEKFTAAGWRQDPLHRVVQNLCKSDELPTRMGWELFIYAP